MNTAYSDLKAAHHLSRIAEMRLGNLIVPPHVQLIISDLCNQDCHFCSYRMSNGFSSEQFVEHVDGGINRNPNRMIPMEKACEIIDDCSRLGVMAMQFTGGGEPTVHPHHLEIFKKAQDLGIETSLVTNGVILRKGWEEIYSRMAWIRVSVDAGTAEVYGRVRNVPISMYQRVMSNIKLISNAVKDSNCLFGAGYVITQENYRDLTEGVKALKDSGVSYVRLSAMFSKEFDSYYKDCDYEIRRAIEEARTYESNGFEVVDLYSDRLADLRQHAPDYSFCGYQQFNVYVGGNLKVYRCCNTSYTKHGEVGDLKEMSFFDWFNSEQRQAAYRVFDARSCEICQFNNKNKVINYMVGNPTHSNFV